MAQKTVIRRVTLPAGTKPEEAALLHRAAADQEDTRQEVRQLLAARPALVEALSHTANELEESLIRIAGGQGVLVHESMRAELGRLRSSLHLRDDGPLEGLLVSQVVLCWLTLTTAERLRAESWRDGISNHSADFWDRHVARLRVDYLRSVRSLASIRRLAIPALQVNIAQQQVNQVVPVRAERPR